MEQERGSSTEMEKRAREFERRSIDRDDEIEARFDLSLSS